MSAETKSAAWPTTGSAVQVSSLRVSHPGSNGQIDIVRGLSFSVDYGQTLALVGESGAGKSLTARALLGLLPAPIRVTDGLIRVGDVEVTGVGEHSLRAMRGSTIGLVPQDPMSALNPVRKIGSIFHEVVGRHSGLPRRQRRGPITAILREVGLSPNVLGRYPHQLSGGMRQRVLIGLALVNEPQVIVADEPTTALDTTVQAQILALLQQRVAGRVALILITHDLGVAAAVCDRIAVMYAGRIVETGLTRDLLERPRHPYTAGLLAAAPDFSPGQPGLVSIPGSPPPAGRLPQGCAFRPRCPRSTDRCTQLPELAGNEHQAACWNPLGEEE